MEKSREELQNGTTEKTDCRKKRKNKRDTVVELTKAALFTAVFCIIAPHTIYLPFSPVGLTMGSFFLYLTGLLLGPKRGCISIFLYLCIGFFGLPVFSGYTAGAGVLLGPTGGFLIGYLPCVVIVGLFVTGRFGGKNGVVRFVAGMLAGTFVLYLFGTLWFLFMHSGGGSPGKAMAVCVLPFVPFDIIKMVLAAVLYKPSVRLKRYV